MCRCWILIIPFASWIRQDLVSQRAKNRWHHFFLALVGQCLLTVSVAVQLQRQCSARSWHISTSLLPYHGLCILQKSCVSGDRNRKREAVRVSRLLLPSSQGFKQCLLPMISWHKSELYKRQMISPEARGVIYLRPGCTRGFDLVINHPVRNLCY